MALMRNGQYTTGSLCECRHTYQKHQNGSNCSKCDCKKFKYTTNKKENKFIGEVKICKQIKFHGIEVLEMEDEYGFEGYYMGDVNQPDYRPAHAIWIKKKDAEKLFKLFAKESLNEKEKTW